MTTLLLATRNAHKVAEIRVILGDAFRYLTLNEFPEAPAVVEDADTFAGNATKKAVELARWLSRSRSTIQDSRDTPPLFVLADDSGLEVDALDGAPGVHSARFAALDTAATGNSSDTANNAKLLRLLRDVPTEKRAALFRCVIAATGMDSGSCVQDVKLFDGVCEGRIESAARGTNGFGYDPLFVPEGFQRTFAELNDEIKNRLSHRARALAILKTWFENTPF